MIRLWRPRPVSTSPAWNKNIVLERIKDEAIEIFEKEVSMADKVKGEI